KPPPASPCIHRVRTCRTCRGLNGARLSVKIASRPKGAVIAVSLDESSPPEGADVASAAETIGTRIKSRRLGGERPMTQQDLAELLGTSRQRVLLWERDKHVPSSGYAVLLSGVLGGDPSDYTV